LSLNGVAIATPAPLNIAIVFLLCIGCNPGIAQKKRLNRLTDEPSYLDKCPA
jgi:hypothetical protein